jgi:hypothetical protein
MTCVSILIMSVVVLQQILWPRLSATRLILVTLYCGISVALCIYGFSLVGRRSNLGAG